MEVHVEHPTQILVGLVAHVPVAVQSGVVHEDVDATEARLGGGDARLHRIDVGDVAVRVVDRAELAQLGDGLGAVRVVDVGDQDRRALAQEAFGVRAADPPRTSGDDGDPSFHAHGSPFVAVTAAQPIGVGAGSAA